MYGPNQNQTSITAQPTAGRAPHSLPSLYALRERQEKIAMLTCYDASMATLMDEAGVDILLIGDSLGMVLQGHSSTLPVTIEDVAYHTACVARGNKTAWVLADMPWGSYHESPAQAYANAAKLMAAGAHMVKIEGGAWVAPTIEFLTQRGVPVCAHIGLTPQYVHLLGGYRLQGKNEGDAQRLQAEALTLQQAGANMLLFELIPAPLAASITAQLHIPTIGIGAGPDCSGQVLVIQDILGIFPGKKARFVKNYLAGRDSIQAAVRAYVDEVKSGVYPAPEHSFGVVSKG
ncbi:3-methyl-2-oxobutanoate hydroxymethyltransferase [Parvibium lacunae]|uniref:3-methyl-2-oxobutanoate hydroxymethyltransferase n=1 Tax=Parvibium lacunae TaxID=1888893 RepID=A0A368L1A9_9BURK|nr:3-methyl-2-oxobutanoate hydroxymethyltransferase [Parvibium lacunae]RCS57357.1 3-methyl-2-oxobutanoate hydroxymethyltransferase [Parvibium lacunae]